MAEKSYPFYFKGMYTNIEPSKLAEGQYPYVINMRVEQEGALSSRTGRKLLGTLGNGNWVNPNMVRKLRVYSGEDPSVPGKNNVGTSINNPRYILVEDTGNSNTGSVIRTYDYVSYSNVKQGLTSAANIINKRMSVSCYSAGAVGSPWAFLAGDARMVKDNGITPYTTLYAWGILPAYGVATVAAVTVSGGGIRSSTLAAGGTGYNVADTFTVNGGSVLATGSVLTVSSGAILTYSISNIGVGYTSGSGVSTTATSGSGTGLTLNIVGGGGNLSGGAQGSPSGSLPYSWIYCYVDGNTNNQGNPSQFMAATSQVSGGQPLGIYNEAATVTVWGTDGTIYDVGDTNITGIAVYRAGGTFADGLYRFVGLVPGGNPGMTSGVAASGTFTDNTGDAQLAFSTTVFFDNNPPVTSSVPQPIVTKVSGGPYSPGQNVTVSLTSTVANQMTRGSTVFFSGGANSEACVVQYINSSSSITVYLQFSHVAGESVEVDALTAQPCYASCTAFDQVFVAGDPNNPHVLYQSKSGYPESFPIIDALGNAHSINVGTPSNGIQNLVEFRGQILCMNVNSLFEVAVIDGIMFSPAEVPGSRGLVSPWAWCQSDNEVWILATDGVYSWDGNIFRKRSEGIDRIFRNQATGTILPLDYGTNTSLSYSNLQWTSMEFYDGMVMLHYADSANHPYILTCEPSMGDRWSMHDANLYNGATVEGATSFMYREEDTGSLIIARTDGVGTNGGYFSIDDFNYYNGGFNYTADEFPGTLTPTTSSGNAGQVIPYSFLTPWFDMGSPFSNKLFTEILLDMDAGTFSPQTLAATIQVLVYINYGSGVVDQFFLNSPSGGGGTAILAGRQPVSLLENLSNAFSGSQWVSYGRKARSIQFAISGTAWPTQQVFYGLTFRYEDLMAITGGHATSWSDQGSRHDKKFHQMTLTYDAPNGPYVLIVDILSGPNAQTYTESVQQFSINNVASVPGNTQMSKTFAIQNAAGTQVIAKMIRVRAVSGNNADNPALETNTFTIQKLDFEAEQFPPDVVAETPWDDNGYSYSKYLNQIVLEVNTNNVAVTVNVQADGATVFTFAVTATETNRQRTITVPTGITGYRWRLYCNPTQSALNSSNNGMFQLFSHHFAFQQADKGEVGTTFDWDDLGHPYDKYLTSVTVEFDNTGGSNVTLQLDVLNGIGGQTLNTNVAQFTLSGSRAKAEFPLPINTIAKLIRLYPVGSTIPAAFKQWKYLFSKVDYPADTVYSTEWRDASSPNDKNPSWLSIDADTNSVIASVVLQNESNNVMTVSHIGSQTNRKYNYPIPVDNFAKMWRLCPATPGSGGKFQLFGWNFERWQPTSEMSGIDPPDSVLWTPWNDFGWAYGSLAQNLVLTIDTNNVACSVQLETEAGVQQTFSVTTTYETRRIVLACNANISGLQWRLLLTPGNGGKSKLWNWAIQVIKLPPAVNQWSSYQQDFGYAGFKFIKQIWVEYSSPSSSINVTIVSDTGTFIQNLPSSATRTMARFYLPAVWSGGFNKSKLYDISIATTTSTDTFQLYGASDIEWIPIGADQHAAFRHTKMSEFMSLPL